MSISPSVGSRAGRVVHALALAASLAFIGTALQANGFVKFIASGATMNEELGLRVGLAMDGDTIIVGAPGRASGARIGNPGRALVVQRDHGGPNMWGEVTNLSPTYVGQFGNYVALSGDYAIVGAREADPAGSFNGGAAAIFERHENDTDAWGQVVALTSPHIYSGGFFGQSVGIDGTWAFVGETGPCFAYPAPPCNRGRVHVYERSLAGGWTLATTIENPDAAPDLDVFGTSVDAEGDTLAVGASGDNNSTGAVFMFERDALGEWSYVQKIVGSSAGGLFSRVGTLALSGDLLAVGAQGERAAYIFERDGTGMWNEVKRLTPSSFGPGSGYGSSIDLKGDLVVVGAPFDDEPLDNEDPTNEGAVYVYDRNKGGPNNWGELVKFKPSDISTGDRFGESVAIHDDQVVVSSPEDDDAAANAGAVYILDVLVQVDADGDGIPDDEDHCIDSDFSPTVVVGGIDSTVTNTLFEDGCTIADLINELADNSATHGDFVSAVAALLNTLKTTKVLTGAEKGLIQSAAAQSEIPGLEP